jgi:molybdopterin adenylyltransferase
MEAKVITVSDSVAAGTGDDRSGPAVSRCLVEAGFHVVEHRVVPDGVDSVREALRAAADGFVGLIVTTGGTGFSPRDLTPEGTAAVIERQAPGLAEAMRAADPRGAMTRGVAGIVGRAILCNVPGSPDGATKSLASVIGVLPHVLALAAGEDAGHH